MKKYISVFITAALLLSMFAGIGGTALASDILKVTPAKTELTSGENVTFNISITLPATSAPLAGFKITCNGSVVRENPATVLNDSSTVPDSFPIEIKTEMLGTPLNFQLCDTSGNPVPGATDTVTIGKKELAAKIAATATSSLNLVAPNDVLTFTVNVENQGEATLENIEVKAPQVKTAWAPAKFSLAPGQKQAVTCQYTVTTAVTITPAVTYTVAGSATPQTYTIEAPIVLTLESRDVKPSLTISNPNPQPGEEVTLTLTVANNGNVPYTDVKVTRGGNPVDFSTNKLDGGQTYTQDYKMTFQTSELVEFVITMKDQKKVQKQVSAKLNVQLPVDPNALAQSVKLVLEPDRTELTSAGTVTFSGYVSNDSDNKISEVSVSEATLGEVYSVSEMEPATKQPVEKTADINGTTTYNFVLTFKDRNGQAYTVNMDPVTVSIQSLEPSPTDVTSGAATVTLEPTDKQSDPLLIWFIIAGVLLVLIIGVGVTIIVLWRKGKTSSRVSAARSAAPRSSGPKPRTPYKSGPRPNKSRGGFRDRNNF